jgi:acetyltransferase
MRSIAPEIDIGRLRSDQPLTRQVDLDSMDWLNLIMGLRDALQADLAESDVDRFVTLDELVARISATRREHGSPSPQAVSAGPDESTHNYRLADGRQVTVRPIRAEDAPLEADFVQHLSSESRYYRFMVTVNELPQAKLKYLTEVDQDHHVALVATEMRGEQEVEVGVARYVVGADSARCEFAIAVDDAWQGSGLSGILMASLIRHAKTCGLTEMEGFIMSANHKMLKFARQMGFHSQRDADDRTTIHVLRTL